MHNHIGCICSTFLHCAFSNVSTNDLPEKRLFWRGIVTLVAFVWLFSTVRFQMWTKRSWIRAGIITLVAFVWFVPTVRLQMCPQMACLRGCVITLVAFTWPHPSFITVLGSSQFRVFNVFFHHYWVLKNICEEKGKVGVLTSTPLMYPGNWCGLRSVFCGNILTKVRVWFW